MPTMTKKHRIRLVDPQGGRSPTAGSASREDRRRWSSRRKTEVVLRILRGETLDALSRELGVSPGRLAEWRDEAIAADRVSDFEAAALLVMKPQAAAS
jgi:transposase-like protein